MTTADQARTRRAAQRQQNPFARMKMPPDVVELCLGTLKAIRCRDEEGTRQLLAEIEATVPEKKQKGTVVRLWNALTSVDPEGRDWVKRTLLPGLTPHESYEEASVRLSSGSKPG